MVLLVSVFFSFVIKFFLVESSNNNNYGGVDQNQLTSFLLSFSGEIFFMVFLPPIMFNSGYQLQREMFFRHLKPIFLFAVVGTAVSSVMTGLIMWGVSTL